ncbi:hypothetical protein [Pseudonocardia sp.]|uniref:hypothetical protein n=1 Tax=Pseudonocardia sp. TaxID=60912 RepID=UPI003D0A46E7
MPTPLAAKQSRGCRVVTDALIPNRRLAGQIVKRDEAEDRRREQHHGETERDRQSDLVAARSHQHN